MYIYFFASDSSTAALALNQCPIFLFDLGDPVKADQGSLGTVTCIVGREGQLPGSDF